jgi:hypothetical protein
MLGWLNTAPDDERRSTGCDWASCCTRRSSDESVHARARRDDRHAGTGRRGDLGEPDRYRDKIVIVAGSSPGTPGKTNALRVHRVCEAVGHG